MSHTIDGNRRIGERTRELQVLRLCARVDLTEITKLKILDILEEELDWVFFLELAHAHKVLPLVYNTLRQINSSKVPGHIGQTIAFRYLDNAQNSKRLANELETIARLFAEANIDIVPFKGSALAMSVYHDLTLRQSGDLDIFVRTADIAAACKILLERGYSVPDQLDPYERRTFLQDKSFMESAESLRQYQFSRDGALLVELHWEIGPRHFPFGLSNGEIWACAVPEMFLEAEVCALPPELMFLLLVNHGSKHGWRRLSWICDIAEMIKQHPNLHWEEMISKAQELRMVVMVKVALRLVSGFLDCPLPPQVAMMLAPNRRVADLYAVVDRIHHTILEQSSFQWHEHYFGMHVTDHLVRRLGYGFFVLTTPTGEEWKLISLPKPLSALYPCVRLLRLAMLGASNTLRVSWPITMKRRLL